MALRPNILLVLADDFGAYQLGATNGEPGGFFSTPALDQLAAEGVRFARAYATAPVCSPARASLYTGLHPARLHLTDFIPGSIVRNAPLLVPSWRRGLPVSAVTLGDALRAQGYATAHFGKWHLAADYDYAPGRPMDPESQGFDEVEVTRKPSPEADPERDPHHIDRLTDRAIAFCTRAHDRPFLCVLAHNAVHRPELAPAAAVARFAARPDADAEVNRPVLGAMVEQLDAACGRLLDALRAAGRERDTIVVFTSDHGPLAPSARRKPLRGAKADLYEGGLRVPLVLRWPGNIAAESIREHLVSGADLFPTLLSAAGAPVPDGLDGLDLWRVIRDEEAVLPRAELCWHYPHYHHLGQGPAGAIRAGDFKLIEWFEPVNGEGGRHRRRPVELYDLAADPGEASDLAAAEPGRVADLLERLHAWRQSVGAQEMQPNPAYIPTEPIVLAPPVQNETPARTL